MIRKEVAEGVYLTHLPSRKFKTGFLSAQFVTPLRVETAACQALLPAVLRRGTMRCPDMESLSAALDQLYGARADYTVRKKGETQCIGFVASAIDDAFVPGGEKLLEPLASLLGELVCDPVTRNGRFLPSYVDSEKDNLADAIRSIINDKRDYADLRLLQEMCQGEPYGVSRLGDLASLEKVNGPKLHARYLQLIASSRLELFYSGQAEERRVEQALREAFSTLPRESIQEISLTARHSASETPRQITESLDVTQGKLGMGFCCASNDVPAMMLVNALFGGTSNSKLFLNVREKLSLCYYASSQYHRSQGLITVSSGIEFANYQQAYDEILLQLQAVQQGDLEDWELEGARSTLCNAFRSMGDSQGRLEDFYLGQAATGQSGTPEDFLRELQEVSLDRVLAAANTVTLDTVYFLQGKEGSSHE